jgi:eukaryotic-like serine/threonine-protein kinase
MRPGDLVGDRFEIEVQAGAGGMGRVFRARDRLTGELVALKVLHRGLVAHSARLLREARILAQLHHPGIVRYIAHGEEPAVFVAIEWLEGEDLARRLSREPLTMGESVELTRRVAEALAAAHVRGVIHRDVKPSNLFLSEGAIDRVKVLDFGIARAQAARVNTRVNTATGQVLGTVGYMAPEQAAAGRDLDPRADIFSLGCVLFECLTGRTAFEGDAPMEVLGKILLDQVPRVSDLQLGVPPSLDELVRRMMSREPTARPPLGVIIAELEALGSLRGGRSSLRDAGGVGGPGLRSLSRDEAAHLYAIVGQEAVTGAGPSAYPTITYDQARDLDAALVEQVSAAGGRLEQRATGVRVAVFPEAGPAAEAAAHAVRCALTMRREWPSHLLAVVSGPSDDSGRMPAPAVFARASAALTAFGASAAAPGQRRAGPDDPGATVIVDEALAALVEGRFELRRGPAGVEVVSEHRRPPADQHARFVGREPELRLVEDVFGESVAESIANAVLVIGAAGSGKSALCGELVRRIRRRDPAVRVWQVAGRPTAAEPLSLLVEILGEALGAPPATGWDHASLRDRLGRSLPPPDVDGVAEGLGAALGVRQPAEPVALPAAHTQPGTTIERVRIAWDRLVSAECDGAPVLLVIDDLHAADLSTIRILDSTLHAARDRRLMVVGLARPTVRGAAPALWPSRRLREVRLLPLTRRGSERLVAAELGAGADPAHVSRLARRGGGNPFWLVQLARGAAGGRPGTPPAVLASARGLLAELEPETRRLLRAASVFGEVFWMGGVHALLGTDDDRPRLDPAIAALVERGLIAQGDTSASGGDDEYAFAHGVVRDAAYQSLTERDRMLGHKLAADWLEAGGERDAMVLAGHFERGGEPRRAVVWFLWATEQAFERNELETVVARAERGIDCDASGAVLGELRLLQAEALGWSGGASRQGDLAVAAMALLADGSAAWCRAAAQRALACARQGDRRGLAEVATALAEADLDAAVAASSWLAVIRVVIELYTSGEPGLAARLADRLETAAPAEPDIDPAVLVASRAWVRAIRALYDGNPAAYLRDGEAIAAALIAAGHRRYAVLAVAQHALAYGAIGDYERATARGDHALRLADELHLEEIADRIRSELGRFLALGGDAARGEAAARRALDDGVARGDRVSEGQARATLAFLLARAGDLDGAAATALEVVEVGAFPRAVRGDAHATRAAALLGQGDARAALEASEQAVELLAVGAPAGDTRARWLRAQAFDALGERDAAARVTAEAKLALVQRAERVDDAAARAALLRNVAEHAAVLARDGAD